MTNEVYNLEEAAEKLQFSETVLVRLSQYFKVPKIAYEDVGYLSFKGDLTFSAEDLAFFTSVKEHLLLGESLDNVKTRFKTDDKPELVTSTVPGEAAPSLHSGATVPKAPRTQGAGLTYAPGILKPEEQPAFDDLQPMREIQNSKPYEKAVEKSFERYKSKHRSGLGKVFENILKELGPPAPERRTEPAAASGPRSAKAAKPIKLNESPLEAVSATPSNQADAFLPFSQRKGAEHDEPVPVLLPVAKPMVGNPSSHSGMTQPTRREAVWEPLIQQATQKPRSLNNQLKNTAISLRERTLGQTSPADDD